MFIINKKEKYIIEQYNTTLQQYNETMKQKVKEWMPFIIMLHQFITIKKWNFGFHKQSSKYQEQCRDEHILYLSSNYMITDVYFGNIHLWNLEKKWKKIGSLKCYIGDFCSNPTLYTVDCSTINNLDYQKLFQELKYYYLKCLEQKQQILKIKTQDLSYGTFIV